MKFQLIIDPEREEEIVVFAHEKSELVRRIEAISKEPLQDLLGYKEEEIRRLDPENVSCFFVEGGRVWAETADGRYYLKERLYRLEEAFSDVFLKINQSCLVNVRKIKRFESTIGASLVVVLEGGHRDFVSRRQLKIVKERMGM